MIKGYFDNAATTYKKPDGMYEYISQVMYDCGANVGRGEYDASMQSGKVVADTRKYLLHLTKAPEDRTVIFTPSATIALNTIIFGIDLKDGDVVYVSQFEHNAVLRPLYALQEKISIVIKFLPMDKENKYIFDLIRIEQEFLHYKPRLVIVSHVSNVTGNIAPVDAISGIAKKYSAITVIDGSQSCGLLACNMFNVDYYVFAGHKTLLGPTGIGGFICKKNIKIKPFVYGGTGIDSANHYMPEYLPERFEAGTLNLMSIVGLNYSLRWIINNIKFYRERENINVKRVYKILSNCEFIKITSPSSNVSGIVSCVFNGYTSDEIGQVLAENGISVRTGLHCAPKAHEYVGSFPEGLVRFSVTCFTDEEDFKVLESVLHKIAICL